VRYNCSLIMNWKRILLLASLMALTACNVREIIPQLQDSYEEVTPIPPPTQTPLPTEVPVQEDASGIGRAFFRAWEGNDYLGMYSLLTPRSQALIDSQSFVDLYEETMATATAESISAQPLSLIQENSQAIFGARVTWETTVVGNITRDHNVPLAYEQGRWGIVWDESLILPELSGGSRLHMDYRIPARANIYDIDGLALAFQGNVISLGVVPGQIEDEEGLLTVLSPVLQKTPEEIREIYAPALPDWYWPIGEIREAVMQEHAIALQPFVGAGLASPSTRLARLYTEGGTAAHIVGYTGYIPAESSLAYQASGYRGDEQVGLAGLEKWGEEYLNGERGGILTVVGSSGEYLTTVQEAESKQARSVYTTINRDFQAAVEQTLSAAINSYPLGQAGSIIVMDANSGAIRAMASYPTYDPAIFDSAREEAAAELGAVLTNPNNPLVNRATQGAYPSGSTFKIVTMAAALNSGIYTADTRYYSTGTWDRLGEAYIKTDWLEGGHGNISLRHALVVSCNSCFYDVGFNINEVDINLLPQTAREFGLGTPTGIQIDEASGLIPDAEWKLMNEGEGWAPGDAVNMAIGQGFVEVVPLQMVDLIAAVANGGTLYRPTVVDRIGAGGGAPEEIWPVQVRGQLPLSPENLAEIQQSLWNVANSNAGTASHRFVGLPVPVAGKTGTAEDPPRNSHAWFVGYAPAAPYTLSDGSSIDHPEIAIVVMIENAGEGSVVAAPIFRRIVELYYGITPQPPFPWES
jgi:penicillin-binding protein 2